MLFIVFSRRTDAIVTTAEGEANTIKEYFTEGGRDLDDYDREEIDDGAFMVRSGVVVD